MAQQVQKQNVMWPLTSGRGNREQPHVIGANVANAVNLDKRLAGVNAEKTFSVVRSFGLVSKADRVETLGSQIDCLLLNAISGGKHGYRALHMMSTKVLQSYIETDLCDEETARYICDVMCNHPIGDTANAWQAIRALYFPEVERIETGLDALSNMAKSDVVIKTLGSLDADSLANVLKALQQQQEEHEKQAKIEAAKAANDEKMAAKTKK